MEQVLHSYRPPRKFTRRILSFENVAFKGALHSSEHNQKYQTGYSEAKLERDLKEKHCFKQPQPKPRTGTRQ